MKQISGSLDRMSPALTPIAPLETNGNEVIEIYDGNDNDMGYGNNEQNDSSSVLVHMNYSQSQEYETVEHSSANQISARKNGSLLYRIQNDLGGDNLRQHLNDSKLQQVKAMKLKELELLQKQTQLIELEKQQQIDSFKLKNVEEIMREQEALQKQFKPDTKKTKLPEYLVESWGHYAIIQSKRKMSKSGRLPMIPHQDLPLAKYLKNNKNVRPTRLFLRDLKKSHIKLPGNNQPEGHSQHQQQQQQQQIQYDARQTHQRHNQYQQRNQQPQQQQQHYEASYQQHHPRQHNGDHYRSPNKYSTSSYHNHNQNSHYNNSHYQYTSPSKSSDTMTTQVHYSNEAEDPFAPTPIQYGEQNVYSYSNSNYNQSTTSNTDSHGWNNTTYQTNSNTQPLGRYNYSLYQPIAPNNAQTQSQPYVNQTSQTWASYRAQAEQHFQMEEQKRQQETKRLEEERRQREQRRLQEQQIQIHQRRLHEIQLQQERMLEEKSRLEQQKQQRFLQQNQQALQKPQLNQASNDNIDPIPQKSLPQLKPQPLTKPPDRLFQRSSPLTSKNGNNKHISNLNNETPEKDTVVLALKPNGFSSENIESMPVVFAFYLDDVNSMSKANERQKKWNGKMREKRITKTNRDTKKPRLNTGSKKVGPELVSEGPAGTELPDGWTTKIFRRKSGKSKGHTDQYWYSAKTQKKMRSKVEIKRFLSCLESSNGDEEEAFNLFKRK